MSLRSCGLQACSLDCFGATAPRNDGERFFVVLSPSLRAKRSNPAPRWKTRCFIHLARPKVGAELANENERLAEGQAKQQQMFQLSEWDHKPVTDACAPRSASDMSGPWRRARRGEQIDEQLSNRVSHHASAADICPIDEHADAGCACGGGSDGCSADDRAPCRSSCNARHAHRGQRPPHPGLRVFNRDQKAVAR